MDKLEEIYDEIVEAKRNESHSDVFNKIDIQNTKKYFRVLSNAEGELDDKKKEAYKEELAQEIEEIKAYGTN